MQFKKAFLAISLIVASAIACTPVLAEPATDKAAIHKLAIEEFRGPKEISLDSDLGYKVKSGELSQYRDDYEGLGRALQKAMVNEMKDKLGMDAVVSLPNHSQAANADSKYIMEGTIDKIRFEGNTLIPNYYELTLSTKVISTETGEVCWQMHHKLFAHMYRTRRSEGAADVFNQMMAPHVASEVADRVMNAIF